METIRKPIIEFFKNGGECNTLSPRRQIDKQDITHIKQFLNENRQNSLEITITFKPILHQLYSSITLTEMVTHFFTSLKLHDKDYLKLYAVGEFSPTGQYHLHGLLETTPRLLNTIKRKIARIS